MPQDGLGLGGKKPRGFISLNRISLVAETHGFSLMGVPIKYERWGSCSVLNCAGAEDGDLTESDCIPHDSHSLCLGVNLIFCNAISPTSVKSYLRK